jgi:hypothetical protein
VLGTVITNLQLWKAVLMRVLRAALRDFIIQYTLIVLNQTAVSVIVE